MKKIGTLTFHNAVNYGAVLQAVALNKALKELGGDAEIIDYSYKSKKLRNSFLGRIKMGGIKKGIEYLIIYPSKEKRKKKMLKFLRNNACLSNKQYDSNNIKDANLLYKAFIAGSDQIFDLERTGNDENFLLDFVELNNKKYSYAASAAKVNDEEFEKIIDYLRDFDGISIREEKLYKRIKEQIDDVYMHIDPTFLINSEEWKKLAKIPKEKNYILVYTLSKSPDLYKAARELSKKTGKKIISISARAEILKGIKKVSTAGVEEFLGYFMNADYVFTNSFHGTAFSVIMERNFSVGLHSNLRMGNDRMETLLDILDLNNCILKYEKNNLINNYIDYKNVRKKIEIERKKSFEYLKKIIDDVREG